MMQLLDYGLLIVGLWLLIKGASLLVDGASAIAKKRNISDLVIGLTIVSFGTSLPELVINLLASINGNSQIAIGNILGSNIANILLILGVSALIYPLTVQRSTILSEIPFSLMATVLVGYLANIAFLEANSGLYLSRIDGGVLLFFFFLYLAYVYSISNELKDPDPQPDPALMSSRKATQRILIGCVALFLGGQWVVDGAISIAQLFNMSESFIGLTIVAIGTSLPELVTSATAAYRKNTDIAVGNVVGSNIFNLLWILGLSAVLRPLPFQVASNLDINMIIISSSLLLIALVVGRKNHISRLSGVLFLLIYIGYIVLLMQRG